MNATQLAEMVRREARPSRAYLSAEMVERLELAGIASWIAQLDDSVVAKAAVTARHAMAILGASSATSAA